MSNLPLPSLLRTPIISVALLKRLNLTACFLFLLQGLIFLLLSVPHSFPIMASYSAGDSLQTKLQGKAIIAPAVHRLFNVDIVYLVAALLFLGALRHILVATVYKLQYQSWLQKKLNYFRWLENAISMSLILFAVSLLAGVYDIGALFLLLVLTLTSSIAGMVIESGNGDMSHSFLMKFIGFISWIAPWLFIAFYLAAANIFGGQVISPIIYLIFVSLLLVFVIGLVNFRYQKTKKGREHDGLVIEWRWIIFGFVVKSLLAWELFAGLLKS